MKMLLNQLLSFRTDSTSIKTLKKLISPKRSILKKFCLLILIILSLSILQAEIFQYYTFRQETAVYVPIAGTSVPSVEVDDGLSSQIDLGFTFPYGTDSFTQTKISSNGWIGFGNNISAPQIFNDLADLNFWFPWTTIAPLWDDLSLAGGSCQYLRDGSAPNRVFKVQYGNAKWNYNANNQFNFQVWLHENGKIEFYYGNSSGSPVLASASIGINMLPHGENYFYSVTPGTPATASHSVENAFVNTFPGNGVKYVFDVIPVIQNDLQAISITGNTTPTQGIPTTYSIMIRNPGTNNQTNYTVRIMSGSDVLASVDGPEILSGQQIVVSVNWVPQVSGQVEIYGNVLLDTDDNLDNNSTNEIVTQVQPTGIGAVTIGNGSEIGLIPVSFYYKNSLFETIYPAEEINIAGVINALSFYSSFETNLLNKPMKIWMGVTNELNLANGWIPSTNLTLVYDGVVTYQTGESIVTITLSTPFNYSGGNLVMMVNRPMDTSAFSLMNQFRCQYGTPARSLHAYHNFQTLNPASPPSSNYDTVSLFPKTTFYLTPSGDSPIFAAYPTDFNFGTVLLENAVEQRISIYNTGNGILNLSNITIAGSASFSISGLPVLPVAIYPMQSVHMICRFYPLTEGDHAGEIIIEDDLTRLTHSIPVTGLGFDPSINASPFFESFDNVISPNLPLGWAKLIYPNNATASVSTEDGGAFSEPYYVQLNNAVANVIGVYLISPRISDDLNLNFMRVKFFARGWFPTSAIQVGIISDPLIPGTFTPLATFNVNGNWLEYIVNLEDYNGSGRYIAFKHGNNNNFEAIHIDNVTVELVPMNDLAAISITGNVTPSVELPAPYQVTITNTGTTIQDNYQVKLYMQGDIEIASVAGALVNPGESVLINLSWTPSEQGQTYIYGKVVLSDDQNSFNDQTANHYVNVQPAGSLVVTVGAGDQNLRIPVNMQYRNSLFETIYQSAELNFVGMINSISFYNDFEAGLFDMPTNIWLGVTELNNLDSNWIPSTALIPVFSGNVDYPYGQNFVTITLSQPFPYNYTSGNLVMMVQRPMDLVFYNHDCFFRSQESQIPRSRHFWNDEIEVDPSIPPINQVQVSGMFPRTSFSVIPANLGSLSGHVMSLSNQPLIDASISISDFAQTTTDAQGFYLFENIIGSTYPVTASRNGYFPSTVNVTIVGDSTVIQDFSLEQMPTISVSGTVFGSDAPGTGIDNATVSISGYESYVVSTGAQGQFTIPGVYVNQSYQYSISSAGYQVSTGNFSVGSENYNLGNITLNEIAYIPRNVIAAFNPEQIAVNLAWLSPDPSAVNINQSFEAELFPPADWTRVINNNGPANVLGVYPTWCRTGAISNGSELINPSDGNWQSGIWWDYNHQDEWLISPMFTCPQNAILSFDTFCFYGSQNGDHYYVKISTDGGLSWISIWDASALTGGWNTYQIPVQLDLSQYYGQQVIIAWHAVDPPSNDGLWYNWFIDNVVVSDALNNQKVFLSPMTITAAEGYKPISNSNKVLLSSSKSHRVNVINPIFYDKAEFEAVQHHNYDRQLVGYKLWRLQQGQEQNENSWNQLTETETQELSFTDIGISLAPSGNYRWAVKAIYTNNIESLPAFSNTLVWHAIATGNVTGWVRSSGSVPITGAVVSNGTYSATSNSSGLYSLNLPVGTYALTCSAEGYQPLTVENIVVSENQVTPCNFTMTTSNTDDVCVDRTLLRGNYPNPFNPETAISFDLKDRQRVRVEIFNVKGQLVRILVDEVMESGQHELIWNGRDSGGKAVASGIYHCRMLAGEYKASKRMMMLK